MCGRFVLNASPDTLKQLFELASAPLVAPRYNIAPTQPVALVRLDPQGKQNQWTHAQWGLIPSWAKDSSVGASLINARSETVSEKPSFRSPFKRRRCLVPVSGFYEWQKRKGGKQPYYIQMADGAPFAFAGLWERWMSGDGSEIETCAILTTTANELMEPIHDRMPVILEPSDYKLWLGSGKDDSPAYLDQLQHLFRPYPTEKMTAYPVDSYVSNARNEGERCIQRQLRMEN